MRATARDQVPVPDNVAHDAKYHTANKPQDPTYMWKQAHTQTKNTSVLGRMCMSVQIWQWEAEGKKGHYFRGTAKGKYWIKEWFTMTKLNQMTTHKKRLRVLSCFRYYNLILLWSSLITVIMIAMQKQKLVSMQYMHGKVVASQNINAHEVC